MCEQGISLLDFVLVFRDAFHSLLCIPSGQQSHIHSDLHFVADANIFFPFKDGIYLSMYFFCCVWLHQVDVDIATHISVNDDGPDRR